MSINEAGTSKEEKRRLFTSNVSSLFDLKGELYRKKHEQRIRNVVTSKPKKNLLLRTKEEERRLLEESKKRSEKLATLEKEIRQEEEAELKRKKILEEKSIAYSRLSNGQLLTTEDGQPVDFLVDFDAKERMKAQKALAEEEAEKQEALNNDNVHFVSGKEQRVYGPSYMPFSQSESKRREQIKQLLDLTKKTDMEREARKQFLAKREEKNLERLNRIRKKKGLPEIVPEVKPPEDEEVVYLDIPLPPEPLESLEVKKRKLHVREWDREKVGYMKWIEAERDKRDEEFQPPSSYFDR